MKPAIPLLVAALAASFTNTRAADQRLPEIPASDFDRLLGMIRPQPGESPWREVEWLTDVTEGRRKSVAEDKPLVIFTAADGSPLGRT